MKFCAHIDTVRCPNCEPQMAEWRYCPCCGQPSAAAQPPHWWQPVPTTPTMTSISVTTNTTHAYPQPTMIRMG